jgi:hypothetical protein
MRPQRKTSRAQTPLDFATGMGLFLLATLFVFVFVPGMFAPFSDTAREETVAADRVADLVAAELAGDPARPYRLDGRCTAALLAAEAAPQCGFDGATLAARLDLLATQSFNLSLRGTPGGGDELLCYDSDNRTVLPRSAAACGSGDTLLRAGDRVPASGSVASARRVVTVGGTTARLEVRMW